MRQLVGRRKTFKSLGDDITLTRFVKLEGGKAARKRPPPRVDPDAAFIREARTKFPTRVLSVAKQPALLVSGHSNMKIGRDVRKGCFRGYWIYSLSLEERATCPRSCAHWQDCYGNNMPFAKRVDHTDPNFLPALEREVARLVEKHRRNGVLIRLHALGDFYSASYVEFWLRMLREHRTLAIYGYTARKPERGYTAVGFGSMVIGVGDLIHEMNRRYPGRCMIRFSDARLETMATVTIMDEADRPDNAFVCPEQTGNTRCCATCGACWSTAKNVAFLNH